LVPEVDTGLQQLLHGDDSHVRSSPIGCPRRPGARRRPWGGPAAGSVVPGGGCPTGGTAYRGRAAAALPTGRPAPAAPGGAPAGRGHRLTARRATARPAGR